MIRNVKNILFKLEIGDKERTLRSSETKSHRVPRIFIDRALDKRLPVEQEPRKFRSTLIESSPRIFIQMK